MQGKSRNESERRWRGRQRRVRRKIERSDRPALTVFRSAKHIYAQIVEPLSGRTLVSVSTRTKGVADDLPSCGNVEAAKRVGKRIAEVAREREIQRVVFNRNGFLYHGRVKALADAAREAGLEF